MIGDIMWGIDAGWSGNLSVSYADVLGSSPSPAIMGLELSGVNNRLASGHRWVRFPQGPYAGIA